MEPKSKIEQTALRAQELAGALQDKEPELASVVDTLARWALIAAIELRALCVFTCQGRENRTDRHRHASECLHYLLDTEPANTYEECLLEAWDRVPNDHEIMQALNAVDGDASKHTALGWWIAWRHVVRAQRGAAAISGLSLDRPVCHRILEACQHMKVDFDKSPEDEQRKMAEEAAAWWRIWTRIMVVRHCARTVLGHGAAG